MNIEDIVPELFSPSSDSERRVYYCQRCLNHGLRLKRKNHKLVCEYRNCPCSDCQASLLILTLQQLEPFSNIANPWFVSDGGPSSRVEFSSSADGRRIFFFFWQFFRVWNGERTQSLSIRNTRRQSPTTTHKWRNRGEDERFTTTQLADIRISLSISLSLSLFLLTFHQYLFH